jgi:hypothetical protein
VATPSSRTINYDALLTSTLDNYRYTLTDNIFTSHVLLEALKKTPDGVMLKDGGERIRIPLMYGKTSVSSYSGYDTLQTDPADGMTAAFYTWRQLATPIAISRIEERQNSRESKIYDLLESKIKQAEQSIAEEINLQLLGKTVSSSVFIAGNGGKDLDPLALQIPKNPTGSVSVGNINQSTYSWWRSRSIDGSSDGGSSTDSGALWGIDLNTWSELFMALEKCYNYCARGAGGTPNMVVTDQAGYETFMAGLRDKTRYTNADQQATLSFPSVAFKPGCNMYWDEFVPDLENGVAYDSSSFAASTYFFLNTKFLHFVIDKETNFINTPFVKPENLLKLVLIKSALINGELPSLSLIYLLYCNNKNTNIGGKYGKTLWKFGQTNNSLFDRNFRWGRICNGKEIETNKAIQGENIYISRLYSSDCYCNDGSKIYGMDETYNSFQWKIMGSQIQKSKLENILYHKFPQCQCDKISKDFVTVVENQKTFIEIADKISNRWFKKNKYSHQRKNILANENYKYEIQTPAETERADFEIFKLKEATVRSTANDKSVEHSRNDYASVYNGSNKLQDAKVAHILVYGNLCSSNRRKQGCVYGVAQNITS